MKLKVAFAAALASVVLLTGCSSPADYVAKNIDPEAQCTQTFNDASFAANHAHELRDILDRTTLGGKLKDQLNDDGMTVCVADLKDGHYLYEPGRKLLIIDHDTASETVAVDTMYRDAAKSAETQSHWSEKLNPTDSHIWTSALQAELDTQYIAHIYKHYGPHSDMWSELKTSQRFSENASLYEQMMTSGSEQDQAMSTAFESALTVHMGNQNLSTDFFEWYASRLEPREVPTMSICLSFDGSLDPCLSSETVYPDKDTGKSHLTAEALTKLASYLEESQAAQILEKARNYDHDEAVDQTYTQIQTKLEDCCDGSRNGGGLGFGGRGLGISLF